MIATVRLLPRSRRGRLAAAALVVVVALLVLAAWTLIPPPGLERLSCTGRRVPNCAAVTGRVLHIQRHDPDGDGDIHLILISKDSLTGPGISLVKIPIDRRPDILPGRLQWVSVVGYTYYGQDGEKNLDMLHLRIGPTLP
jgi:hypothetical protein